MLGLSGEKLSRYDGHSADQHFDAPNSEGWADCLAFLHENFTKPAKQGGEAATLRAKRARFETMSEGRIFDCEHRADSFTARSGNSVDGEWTLVDGADPTRRILYLHGGAYAVGSAKSHRAITYNLAKRTGCAVFAPNYRLIPENKRLDCLTDCQDAYLWALKNGPDGAQDCRSIAVMGDSAGGNLSLVVGRWASADSNVTTPSAIVGLSAHTDSTAQSPSLKGNLETDVMLKPMIAPLVKIPRALYLLATWKIAGTKPSDPKISPIMGDLSDLPPTLLQVSASEVLYDDSLRYAAKARQHGSTVYVQSWRDMCHVWHIFDDMLPEAHAAFDQIADFLASHDASAKPPH